MKSTRMSWCIAIVAVIGIALVALSMAGCDTSTGSTKQTPVAADYDIGNLSQTAGSVTAVTITPKSGKSPGSVTIKYDGAAALPQTAGTYAVTFDVAAARGWNEASGLSAGNLTVNPAGSNQTPVAADYDIGNLSQREGSIVAVTVTPKSDKSTGAVTIKYAGETTLPQTKGTYPVTFDVAAVTGWNAASGLSAGNLVIVGADENLSPTAGDYDIGNLSQTAGSVTAVTITPKSGKSTGAVSNIRYNNSTTLPQTAGTYAVTFDVAAVTGWNAASGLSAGNLVIVGADENLSPTAGDYDIGNLSQTAGSVTAVTITPKSGKSSGAVSNIRYNNSATIPQTAGTYAVTFDVAAVTGWSAASGLSAGNLTVNPVGGQEHELTLRPEGTLTMTTVAKDSTPQPYTVTVLNTGTAGTGLLTIAFRTGVTYTDNDKFTLSEDNLSTIASGASATFTVTPKTDTVGTFTATIRVTSANTFADIPVSVTVGYTVTFDSNGGSAVANQTVANGTAARPDEPTRARKTFAGWYTEDGNEWNFDEDTITANITLYARWSFTLPLTDISDIEFYLAALSAGDSADEPASLPVNIDLGAMTAADSGWKLLLTAIEEAGKYVGLDLSACTMSDTSFNPDSAVATGKDKIVAIALPDTATSIVGGSYSDPTFKDFTSLRSFSGAGLTSIGWYAFDNCTNLALTGLPAGLTSIGSEAFSHCTNLALTELPAGLTSIDSYAFYNCTNLALTELPVGITKIGYSAFQNCTNLALTELPAGLTSIGEYAFNRCTNLALTELPEGITSIGSSAFYGCTNLALTELPEGITSIGSSAFYGCANLALTELPAGITSIGNFAFQSCTNLALTELPAGITSIGQYAFQSCTNLALTELPAGITEIGSSAFSNCTNLALTGLPAGITSISNSAFENCTNLALTELPAGITSIGDRAFYNCTNLALTELPAGITSIGEYAFQSCTNLATVICHAEEPPTLGTMVFYNTSTSLVIKVPAGSIEAYKAAENWSGYATRIVAIE